jgi:hypothetical protein
MITQYQPYPLEPYGHPQRGGSYAFGVPNPWHPAPGFHLLAVSQAGAEEAATIRRPAPAK